MTDRPEQSGEAVKKGQDVDALEKEFDAQVKNPTISTDPDFKEVVTYVKQQKQESDMKARDEGITSVVSALRQADELKELPDAYARGFAFDYAYRNPDFDAAFKARKTDPNKWSAAVEKMRTEAVTEFKRRPDETVTKDLRAAAAAVRGTSIQAPRDAGKVTNAELNKMSDAEFRKFKASQPA